MIFLQRLFLVLTLCLGLTATSIDAYQIRQPASVLPWQAPPLEAKLALNGPAASGNHVSPHWLLDAARQRPQRSEPRKDLPAVEPESYVHLGELQASADKSHRRSVQQNRLGVAAVRQPLSLLRALGIGAPHSGNRQ